MDLAAHGNRGFDRERRLALIFSRRGALVLLAAVVAACSTAPRHHQHLLPVVESPIPLPPGFPAPSTPSDNPLTIAKAELGRYLFYDKRLSLNQTQSCASCHQQQYGFCDARAHAIGSTGEEHFRNTMELANVGYRHPLTWSDRKIETLEQQVLVPLTNHKPVELGMDGHFDTLIARIRNEARYRAMFAAAFPDQTEPITIDNIARALASFERTLISADAPYDRLVLRGDSNALTDSAWRGRQLFFSAKFGCASCHGGPDFATPANGDVFQGGEIRVVSLRNIAVTAPYMHDGSVATLTDVLDRYSTRGRMPLLKPVGMTSEQKRDLLAFLESLTDRTFLADARFSDPWPTFSPPSSN